MKFDYKEQQKYFADPLFKIEGVGTLGCGNEFGRDFWSAVEVAQFCSERNLKTIKRLILAIRKMVKDEKLELPLIHNLHNSAECFLYMFLAYRSVMPKHKNESFLAERANSMWELYNDKSRHIFVDLLMNDGKGLQYRGQSARSKKILVGLAKEVKDIAEKLKGHSELLDEDKKANEILFWHVEYIKRKLKLDLIHDPVFFDEFNEFYKSCNGLFDLLVKVKSSSCRDCGWGTQKKGWPFDFLGIGCGNRRCDFSVYQSQQIERSCMGLEFYDPTAPTPALPPFQFCKSVKVFGGYFSTMTFGLDLATKYGVYPYELFHLSTAEQITNSLKSDEGLPERYLFSNIRYVRDPKPMSAAKAVSTRLKNVKATLSQNERGDKSNYHDLNENRIIGLWLWDNLHLPKVASGSEDWGYVTKELASFKKNTEDSLLQYIQKLPHEKWSLRLDVSKNDGDVLRDDVSWEDKKYTIENYRKHYKLAKKCIEQGKVLPLNSV